MSFAVTGRFKKMWPVLWAGMRTYAPYIVFPAALAIGTVGYFLEYHLSDRHKGRIQAPSTLEQRNNRKLHETTSSDLNSFKKFHWIY